MVPEEMVFVLADLDGTSTVLHHGCQQTDTHSLLNSVATHLRDQNAVAGLHRDPHPLAIFIESARAHGEYLGLRQLLDSGFGEEDSGGGLGLGLDALDEDAVEERCKGLDGAKGSGLYAVGVDVSFLGCSGGRERRGVIRYHCGFFSKAQLREQLKYFVIIAEEDSGFNLFLQDVVG